MSEDGRLKDAIEKFVVQTLPGINFYAQYPGAIISQTGQTFDFQPDDPSMPGVKGLSFYAGSPGIAITVDTTQSPRAVMFFAGFQPSAPALGLFGNPGLAKLSISASQEIDLLAPAVKIGNNATLEAARKTDAVQAATSMAAFITSVIAAFAANAGTPETIQPPTDFGVISGGSSEVKIG